MGVLEVPSIMLPLIPHSDLTYLQFNLAAEDIKFYEDHLLLRMCEYGKMKGGVVVSRAQRDSNPNRLIRNRNSFLELAGVEGMGAADAHTKQVTT